MGFHVRRTRCGRDSQGTLPGALAIIALALLTPAAASDQREHWVQPELPSAPATASVIVTEADDGRILNLRRGEQLRIVLRETAGTGYSWEIEAVDRHVLRLEGRTSWQDPGPPPPPGLKGPAGVVGGPLQLSLLFRAVATGEGELRLRHWRPWEGPRSVDRRLRLRVRVVA